MSPSPVSSLIHPELPLNQSTRVRQLGAGSGGACLCTRYSATGGNLTSSAQCLVKGHHRSVCHSGTTRYTHACSAKIFCNVRQRSENGGLAHSTSGEDHCKVSASVRASQNSASWASRGCANASTLGGGPGNLETDQCTLNGSNMKFSLSVPLT